MRCNGSAHCMVYCENGDENLNSISYWAVHSNEVWFSEEIRSFCHDRTQEIRWKYLRDIRNCPLCDRNIIDYKPIPYLAKICARCNVLYVNEDVYTTYTADVNRNLGNSMLCLVGITPPRVKTEKVVKSVSKKRSKMEKKQKQENKTKNKSTYTLGDDPRFKELFADLRKQ